MSIITLEPARARNQASQCTLPPVIEFLKAAKGKRVFYDPLIGNNGDRLIHHGSLEALRMAGITPVPSCRGADLIVMNGGAGTTDIWSLGLKILRYYSESFPATPLAILPSSYWFQTTNFPSLFAQRTSPAYLYARERTSLSLIEGMAFPCEVSLGLDHDMAFHLAETDYVRNLAAAAQDKHVLIVEREDAENFARVPKTATESLQGKLISRLPLPLRRAIWNHRISRKTRNAISSTAALANRTVPETDFVRFARAAVRAQNPAVTALPEVYIDASDPALVTFDVFLQLICESALIVTTRLHVAILGGLLGKPTLVRASNFHKIRGIYELSMQNYASVRMI